MTFGYSKFFKREQNPLDVQAKSVTPPWYKEGKVDEPPPHRVLLCYNIAKSFCLWLIACCVHNKMRYVYYGAAGVFYVILGIILDLTQNKK